MVRTNFLKRCNSRQNLKTFLVVCFLVVRSTAYLTRVFPSFPIPGTNEYVGDVLPKPGLLVHGLALGVVNDGEIHFLQNRR